MSLSKLIGLKVVAVKGFRERKNQNPKSVEPSFVLFNDKKTFVEISEQDYYTFHDCAYNARHINIWQGKERWKHIMESENYIDAEATI